MSVFFITKMLECIPPVFNVGLISGLTYFTVALNKTQPYVLGISAFIVAQIVLNWIQFLRNMSIVTASSKNFPGYVHRFPPMSSINTKDFNQPQVERENIRKEWRECNTCDMHVPVRSHHCTHCKRCIYVLDHHCYFLGHCVGRTNQRYFLVFCFYAGLGASVGVCNLVNVMSYYRDPWTSEIAYYFLPYTSVMWFLNKAADFELLYVTLINFGLGAILSTGFLFLHGMLNVLSGSTPHENKKKIRSDDNRNLSVMERLCLVFGPWPIVCFMTPFAPFDGPEVVQGFRRLII